MAFATAARRCAQATRSRTRVRSRNNMDMGMDMAMVRSGANLRGPQSRSFHLPASSSSMARAGSYSYRYAHRALAVRGLDVTIPVGLGLSSIRRWQSTEASRPSPPAEDDDGAIVIDVVEEAFQRQVLQVSQTVPVVLQCHADWCKPCKQLEPVLERVAMELGGRIRLAKVDVDKCQQLAGALNVSSVPAVFALFDGKVVDSFVGMPKSDQELQTFFEKLVTLGNGNMLGGASDAGEAQAEEDAEVNLEKLSVPMLLSRADDLAALADETEHAEAATARATEAFEAYNCVIGRFHTHDATASEDGGQDKMEPPSEEEVTSAYAGLLNCLLKREACASDEEVSALLLKDATQVVEVLQGGQVKGIQLQTPSLVRAMNAVNVASRGTDSVQEEIQALRDAVDTLDEESADGVVRLELAQALFDSNSVEASAEQGLQAMKDARKARRNGRGNDEVNVVEEARKLVVQALEVLGPCEFGNRIRKDLTNLIL